MGKWFWSLSFIWQNIIGFGTATVAGVGIAWVIVRIIPAEYKEIASFILLLGAVGCLLRVSIGMYLDGRKDSK